MLSFAKQYDIAFSMFLTYNKKSINKISHVYHNTDSMETYRAIFPISKYEAYTSSKFSLTVLYIIYTHNPSSFYSIIEQLQNIEYSTVDIWYKNILAYSHNITVDVEYLIQKYGVPKSTQMLQEFYSNKIQFYTLWWYLKYTNTLENSMKSNIYGPILYKIQFMLLYIKFKESSLERIKTIFIQSDILN